MIEKTAHAPRQPAASAPVDADVLPLTILLVDDNQTFLTAVRQFLDRLAGVRIVGQSHDGKTALALVRAQRPAMVLLDIAMPGMNGLELARALLQDAAAPQLVFLSMHDNREYRAAADELGAQFVSKSDFVTDLLPLLARGSAARMPMRRHGDVRPRGELQADRS